MPPRRYMHSIGLASGKETGALTDWWSLRAVRDTLNNKVYYGVMIQGRSQMKNGEPVKLPESEWAVTENAHEAIISRELYEAVQKAWVRQNTPKEPYYKSPNTDNIFIKKLYCAQCGHAILRKRGGEKYYKYWCNVNIMYTKDACGGFKISEMALKELMLDMIRRYEPFLEQALQPTKSIAIPSIAAVSSSGVSSDTLKNELTATQIELDKNSRFLKGLYESLMNDVISDNEYKDMKGDYEAKIAVLAAQVNHLRESVYIRVKQEKELSQAHKSVQTIERISDLTAEIIDKLFDKIRIYQDGRLEVKFRFLDDVVYSHDKSAADMEGGVSA